MKKLILLIPFIVLSLFFSFGVNSNRTQQQEVTQAPITSPTRLEIPSLKVNAEVEPVTQTLDRQMESPSDPYKVGWYSLGTIPGNNGSAVMAGHLDTIKGDPAVFYDLSKIDVGDEIIVTTNQDKLTFKVKSMMIYEWDKVPMEEVFNTKGKVMLNLITCTGVWDGKNYSERLVVFSERRENER